MYQKLRLSIMCKQEKFPTTLQRKSYSLSEKQSILELYFQSGINCRQFAIQHGLEYKTLWNWVSSCKSAKKMYLCTLNH